METNSTPTLTSHQESLVQKNIPLSLVRAQQVLSNGLKLHDHKINWPIFYNRYGTTLFLIFLIHFIFVCHWRTRKTKKDVTTSYRKLVKQKQFYKAVIALLSHPPPDNCWNVPSILTVRPIPTTTRTAIDVGNSHYATTVSSVGFSHSMSLLRRFVLSINDSLFENHFVRASVRKMYIFLFHPLIHGHLAGLPLVMYISHILWQCRALEELYDFAHDHGSDSFVNEDIDWLTISRAEEAVMKYAFPNFITDTNEDNNLKREQLVSSYYLVLLALALTSLVMDLCMTHWVLQSTLTRRGNYMPILRSIVDRSICTLTPLCASVLVLFTSHFPHIPISVLPFGSRAASSSPLVGFVMSYIALGILSYRAYPLLGVTYGTFSGILWTMGLTQFLATQYWGHFCVAVILFGCALSYKLECTNNRGRNFIDWLPCVDYVAWDVRGNIQTGSSNENDQNVLASIMVNEDEL